MTGKEIHTQRNRFFTAFLEKSRKECVKMGLAHEKKSYLQEKANLFEIGSQAKGLNHVEFPKTSNYTNRATNRYYEYICFFSSIRNGLV